MKMKILPILISTLLLSVNTSASESDLKDFVGDGQYSSDSKLLEAFLMEDDTKKEVDSVIVDTLKNEVESVMNVRNNKDTEVKNNNVVSVKIKSDIETIKEKISNIDEYEKNQSNLSKSLESMDKRFGDIKEFDEEEKKAIYEKIEKNNSVLKEISKKIETIANSSSNTDLLEKYKAILLDSFNKEIEKMENANKNISESIEFSNKENLSINAIISELKENQSKINKEMNEIVTKKLDLMKNDISSLNESNKDVSSNLGKFVASEKFKEFKAENKAQIEEKLKLISDRVDSISLANDIKINELKKELNEKDSNSNKLIQGLQEDNQRLTGKVNTLLTQIEDLKAKESEYIELINKAATEFYTKLNKRLDFLEKEYKDFGNGSVNMKEVSNINDIKDSGEKVILDKNGNLKVIRER